MTEHVEGTITGSSGGQIYWQGWLPGDPAIGVVVISHGIAEHGARYTHVAERLTAAGYAVYAVDHQGHGRSEGTRGNIERMSGVTADLRKVITLAGERHPEIPVFLHGHSLGGLIALDCVIAHEDYANGSALRGLSLSGPAVDVAIGSTAQRLAAKLLSALTPNFGVLALDSSFVSRDADVVAAYNADPLVYHGKIRARTGAEGLAATERVAAHLSTVELPVLVMHGTKDKLAAPSSARAIADGVSSKDLTVKLYDGLYHEVFNEPEQDRVLDDLLAWLAAHT